MSYSPSASKGNALIDNNNSRLMISQVPSTYVIKKVISYTDLAIAATTNNIEIYATGSKCRIVDVFLKHSAAFTGGSISSYTISVGDTGGSTPYDEYMTAQDVFVAPGDTDYHINVVNQVQNWSGITQSIGITATASHNLNTATAGSVEIQLTLMDINDVGITP